MLVQSTSCSDLHPFVRSGGSRPPLYCQFSPGNREPPPLKLCRFAQAYELVALRCVNIEFLRPWVHEDGSDRCAVHTPECVRHQRSKCAIGRPRLRAGGSRRANPESAKLMEPAMIKNSLPA